LRGIQIIKSIVLQAVNKIFQHSKKTSGIFTLTLFLLSSFLILSQNVKAQEPVCSESIITQITDNAPFFSGQPSINSDGTMIAFVSQTKINEGNIEDNPEIYLYNTVTKIFTPITDTTGVTNEFPSIDADGSHIVFQSDADFTGENTEGSNEVFLVTCIKPVTAHNIPTLSEWGLIAMAGVLGIIGFLVIRRKKATA